jgi:D-alanine-D-alanine ligase
VLVEERIEGKEVTCGVLEDPEPRALATIEVRTPRVAWYDYEHRYTKGLSEHLIPAKISHEQNRRVMEIAVQAHRALGCRDLSRADFVVPESGEPILLEVNTIPGMTPTSLFPDSARGAGYTFDDVLRKFILRAWERRDSMPMRVPR